MTTATRCCSCGDEIARGSITWPGGYEDEKACSALCHYRAAVEATYGRHTSSTSEREAGAKRVRLLRKALLYDPEMFGDDAFNVTVAAGDLAHETSSAAMIVLGADQDGVRFEIVGSDDGEFDGDEFKIDWDDLQLVDVVPRT